jgi:hypothetical protein
MVIWVSGNAQKHSSIHINKVLSVRFHCHYAISCYHGNEFSSVNTLHEGKFCSTSRTSEQFLFHCILFVLWILISFWYAYMNCSIPDKECCLGFTTCACYLCEMALVSTYHSITSRSGEEARDVTSTEAEVTNSISPLNSQRLLYEYH